MVHWLDGCMHVCINVYVCMYLFMYACINIFIDVCVGMYDCTIIMLHCIVILHALRVQYSQSVFI